MIGLGELLAFASSILFSLSVVYLKLGQNQRPNENGVFMTSLVNLGMYALMALALLPFGGIPALTTGGVVFFVIAGFTNTLFGRWAWLQSVRAIGPSRGTALKVTAPVFSSALGFLLVGEPVTVPMVIGILVVIAGVMALSQESGSPAARGRVSSPGDPPAIGAAPRRRFQFSISEPAVLQGIVFGLLSALAYGSGSVLRRLGLDTLASPVMGALIGSIVAVGAVLVADAMKGNLRQRWADNVTSVPMPFVVAGVLAGFAQLSSFAALLYTTIAISSTIGSTQSMFAAIFSLAFFRSLDTITTRSVLAMVVITAGIGIVLLFRA